ncbi:MAG: PAS domain S-box protein [Acidobacteria bacterium]|nr:PAS domain S-box protein [Acidobacteriota bacterium]
MKNHAIRLSAHQAAAELAIVQSVAKILWRSIAVVAATEMGVMLLLKASGQPITLWTSLMDTLLLSAVALPTLYAVTLRPVAHLAAQYSAAAAEARFQAIAGAVQDGIVISGWDRKIRFANQAAEKMFGHPAGVLQGRELEELMPPEYVQRCREGMARYRATGEPRVVGKGVVELEGQRLGGERFPVEFSLNELTLANEKSFVAVIRNISERKRGEEALRQAEERYRGIFNDAVLGIFQTTPDGRYLSVNPAMAQMYGFASPEELMASRTDIARQAYVRPEQREEFKRRIEQEGAVEGIEYEVYRKDGNRIWFRENARAVRDAGGQILYYVGTVEDVTESKRAVEALRASEQKFRELLEHLPVAVRIVRAGKLEFVNPADARLHGYESPVEEIKADAPFAHLVPEDVERMKEYSRKRAAGEEAPLLYEVGHTRKDGSEIRVEVHAERVVYEGKPASLLVLLDLTERTKLRMYEQILPVCCTCGKIRNDEGVGRGQGAWERLDHYVAQHSDAQVSHTFCPECLEEYRRGQGLK